MLSEAHPLGWGTLDDDLADGLSGLNQLVSSRDVRHGQYGDLCHAELRALHPPHDLIHVLLDEDLFVREERQVEAQHRLGVQYQAHGVELGHHEHVPRHAEPPHGRQTVDSFGEVAKIQCCSIMNDDESVSRMHYSYSMYYLLVLCVAITYLWKP